MTSTALVAVPPPKCVAPRQSPIPYDHYWVRYNPEPQPRCVIKEASSLFQMIFSYPKILQEAIAYLTPFASRVMSKTTLNALKTKALPLANANTIVWIMISISVARFVWAKVLNKWLSKPVTRLNPKRESWKLAKGEFPFPRYVYKVIQAEGTIPIAEIRQKFFKNNAKAFYAFQMYFVPLSTATLKTIEKRDEYEKKLREIIDKIKLDTKKRNIDKNLVFEFLNKRLSQNDIDEILEKKNRRKKIENNDADDDVLQKAITLKGEGRTAEWVKFVLQRRGLTV
jgi:hypothetical protein